MILSNSGSILYSAEFLVNFGLLRDGVYTDAWRTSLFIFTNYYGLCEKD